MGQKKEWISPLLPLDNLHPPKNETNKQTNKQTKQTNKQTKQNKTKRWQKDPDITYKEQKQQQQKQHSCNSKAEDRIIFPSALEPDTTIIFTVFSMWKF